MQGEIERWREVLTDSILLDPSDYHQGSNKGIVNVM